MFFLKFEGRLGNVIMQYTQAVCMSRKYGFPIIVGFNKDLQKIFKTKINFFRRWIYSLFTFLIKIIYFKELKSLVVYDNAEDRKIKVFGKFNLFYHQFRMQYLLQLLQDNKIQLNTKYGNKVLKKYNLVNTKYIAIHIRGTDFKEYGLDSFGFDCTLPLEYYVDILSTIKKDLPVIICTDDVQKVKKSNLFPNADIQNRSATEDFIILQNASFLITANSTFSYSAMFLSKNLVMAYIPKYGFGQNVKKYHLLIDNDLLLSTMQTKLTLVD